MANRETIELKILWLSHLVPYPPKAGVLLRAYNLVKELSKHHEVHLLAFNQRNLIEPYFDSYDQGTEVAFQAMSEICSKVQFINCPTDSSRFKKMQCAALSLVSKKPYTINWLEDEGYRQAVGQWHHQESYDLVHCDTISLAPYVNQLEKTLFSLDHHNVESHMLARRSELESNGLKKFYYWQEGIKLEHYEKKICPQFNTNLTCSALDSARFAAIAPQASFTEIPNGVDTDFFIPSSREPEPANFIFIGTLDWYPNTRAVRFLAKEIWPKLKAAIPAAVINIIGSGAPNDLIAFGETNADFNMLGFVDDLQPYLEKATAYLCPIDDGGGTKLKLLDAFASGKAVIAHTVAAEGLKAINGKHLLLADSAQAYVQHILRLQREPALRKHLEKNARQHAINEFSFDAIGLKLGNHFSNLKSRKLGGVN